MLDKAILHGKEKRKSYKGAKSVDVQCRNHGSCSYCNNNRNHHNKKRLQSALEHTKSRPLDGSYDICPFYGNILSGSVKIRLRVC